MMTSPTPLMLQATPGLHTHTHSSKSNNDNNDLQVCQPMLGTY